MSATNQRRESADLKRAVALAVTGSKYLPPIVRHLPTANPFAVNEMSVLIILPNHKPSATTARSTYSFEWKVGASVAVLSCNNNFFYQNVRMDTMRLSAE